MFVHLQGTYTSLIMRPLPRGRTSGCHRPSVGYRSTPGEHLWSRQTECDAPQPHAAHKPHLLLCTCHTRVRLRARLLVSPPHALLPKGPARFKYLPEVPTACSLAATASPGWQFTCMGVKMTHARASEPASQTWPGCRAAARAHAVPRTCGAEPHLIPVTSTLFRWSVK